MNMKALEFVPGNIDNGPVTCRLDLSKVQDFEKQIKRDEPTVWLINDKNLEELRQFKDFIIDKKIKNKARPLSQCLLGNQTGKAPMINGGYSASGQLKRSIREFLKNAVESGENGLYIIGATSDIFNKLWEEADKKKTVKEEANDKKDFLSYSNETGESASAFLNHLEEEDVPLSLKKRYVGKSDTAKLVRQLIVLAGKNTLPVLILGYTGTGKEVIAREIHNHSNRRRETFVAVNCSAIPEGLFESELFGHEKGAFTDAHNKKTGLWEDANKGTLFLDEIGDLNINHQAKILRSLEDRKIRRVGGIKDILVDARIIAATNHNLNSQMQLGTFREDLYYRLNSFPIFTSPLRDHPEDVPLLAQHFWRGITSDDSRRLSEEILNELKLYDWPGNARELQRLLNNLFAIFRTKASMNKLRIEDLRFIFRYMGQKLPVKRETVTEKELMFHKPDCLRHLKRVNEVLFAVKAAILSLWESHEPDEKDIKSVETLLKLRRYEIESLCKDPSLFYSYATFSVVWNLLKSLIIFHDKLQKDIVLAQTHWSRDLSDEFVHSMTAVFDEIKKIISNN